MRQLREGLGTNAAAKVASILHYMNSLGLNLPLFLDLLSWGDQGCITHPKIRYKRSALHNGERRVAVNLVLMA